MEATAGFRLRLGKMQKTRVGMRKSIPQDEPK
jgi:hypothetical protein